MKKTELLSMVGIGLVLAGFVLFLFFQIKSNSLLRKQLAQLKDDLASAKAASRQLENLEKMIEETDRKAHVMYRQVPQYEELPFSLVKSLLPLVTEAGLREVKYDLTQEHEQKSEDASGQGVSQAIQDPEDAELEAMGMRKSTLAITCRATYPQVVRFVERLAKFERLTAVKGISVERDEKILPYQRISFKLVAFTFTK